MILAANVMSRSQNERFKVFQRLLKCFQGATPSKLLAEGFHKHIIFILNENRSKNKIESIICFSLPVKMELISF